MRMMRFTRFYSSTVRIGLIAVFVCSFVISAEAATVRGRLVRRTPQGFYPAQGVPVTVFSREKGRSGASYSGPDGMYYLYNIPPGPYTLEVWVYPNQPPM